MFLLSVTVQLGRRYLPPSFVSQPLWSCDQQQDNALLSNPVLHSRRLDRNLPLLLVL
jgi:hypothetical protein